MWQRRPAGAVVRNSNEVARCGVDLSDIAIGEDSVVKRRFTSRGGAARRSEPRWQRKPRNKLSGRGAVAV